MKIIFLDIDGVLNVIPQGRDKYGSCFHKHFEENLKWIVKETNAKIVISSTWRFSGIEIMKEMWKERDLPGDIIDITPFTSVVTDYDASFSERAERGNEIRDWLNKNGDVEKYVILDDDNDMLREQQDFFVKCSGNQHHEDSIDIGYGLTRQCAEKAIKILNS